MGAVGERPLPSRRRVVAGQDHDGHIVVLSDDLAQLVHDGDAIYMRHMEIQKNEVWSKFLKNLYRLTRIVEAAHVAITSQFQDGRQYSEIVGLIVNDQNAGFGMGRGTQGVC